MKAFSCQLQFNLGRLEIIFFQPPVPIEYKQLEKTMMLVKIFQNEYEKD